MPQGENAGDLVTQVPESPLPASQPERLEVSYRLTVRDARNSYFQALCRHPRRKRVLQLYFFLAPLLLGLAGWMVVSPLYGTVVAIAMWLAIAFLVPWEVGRKTMRQHGARGFQRLCVSPENITGSVEGIGELKYDWGFVQQVTDSPDFIAFHWMNGRTSPIPKRAFPDAQSATRFAQAAIAWHAAATRRGRSTGSELTPSAPEVIE